MASSRFWAGDGSSGSGSESDSDSDSSAVGNQRERRQWALDSDSESDEEVRVVKSAKDRSWEAIKVGVSKVRNNLKINDWNGVQTGFDDLNKQMEKAKALVAKDGVPNFYVKLLVDLEDSLVTTLKNKEAVKKMSATNTRSLNRMKLQLKKHNKSYETQIVACRADPASFAEDADEESDKATSGSDGDSEDSDDSDSESSSSGSDSDSDSSSSESEKKKKKTQKVSASISNGLRGAMIFA
jgi:translation initiation factor 3 subunit C